MDVKQSNWQEIVGTEQDLAQHAEHEYGEVFITALGLAIFFGTFIKSIDDPEKFAFVAFHSHTKKHLLLALLSAVRRHHVQSSMDMRQVLEAGAWAAYAMAHADTDRFARKDADGVADVPKALEEKRNKWLQKNYGDKSNEILRLKKNINQSAAHSNILYASTVFEMRGTENPGFNTPFFDLEYPKQVLADIWFVGNTAMGLIDLFYGVNAKEKVFQVVNDFHAQFRPLVDQSNRQREELRNQFPTKE